MPRRRGPSSTAGAPRKGSLEGEVSFDTLCASGEACVLVTNAKLEVRSATRSTEQLLGQPRESLVGQQLQSLLEALPALPAAGDGHGTYTTRVRRASRGLPVRVLWAREADRLELLLLDLDAIGERPLGVTTPDLSRFASVVAHEIRNPLSSVKIVIQTLARAPDRSMDERAERRLAIATREIRTVERILSALSELAHAAELRLADSEVGPLMAEALQAAEVDLADRSVLVRTDIEDGLPRLTIDPNKVRTALTHLLVNAAHAIGVGGEIRLGAHAARGGVTLQLLYTAPLGATQASGAEISLEMAKAVARAHGGYLSVVAGEQGTDCSLFLPSGKPEASG